MELLARIFDWLREQEAGFSVTRQIKSQLLLLRPPQTAEEIWVGHHQQRVFVSAMPTGGPHPLH
jgi:hypothetical protein